MKKVKVQYRAMGRDGFAETFTTTAWEHDDGRLYEHKLDRDGWPIEIPRDDYQKIEEA